MTSEDTLVLEKNYLAKAKASHEARFGTENAPVIGGKLTCNGESFRWWAIGHGPYRVVVHNPIFGSRMRYTGDDVESFARGLAEEAMRSFHSSRRPDRDGE